MMKSGFNKTCGLATLVVFCTISSLISISNISAQRTTDTGSQLISNPVISNGTSINNIFTTQISEVNEGTLGIPGDVYSIPVLIVNRGDNVTINFFNDDRDAADRHTFTINEPYNINKDLATGASAKIDFTADKDGIFMYIAPTILKRCTGTMLVLP